MEQMICNNPIITKTHHERSKDHGRIRNIRKLFRFSKISRFNDEQILFRFPTATTILMMSEIYDVTRFLIVPVTAQVIANGVGFISNVYVTLKDVIIAD